jgi:LPS-assembly protein
MRVPDRFVVLSALSALCLLSGPAAQAQVPVPGFRVTKQFRLERLGEDHIRLTGQVQMEDEGGSSFFADEVDYFPGRHLVVARGHVVFASKEARIAADRMEFDTESRTGIFYNASGTASLGDRADRSMFGTQEPDAYFYGETIEKLGPAKYRIRKGGFTTCVQPTPRWEVTATTVTLTIDEYAIVRNSVLRVKDVPVFYMPIFYYPVQKDDRATGFLIPTYGTSTVRGQSLSNAFFWAIDRSQDATFLHDWFSQAGTGMGAEYRYIAGPGSDGFARTYFLREREGVYVGADGTERVRPERRSYEVRARLAQRLPAGLRARADIDYFSDVTVQQIYQTNLYEATQRQRSYGGNVAGGWGANSVSATYSLRELFYGESDSTLYGSAPRLSYNRAPRRLPGMPVYFSVAGELNRQVRTNRSGEVEQVLGLTKIDATPTLRLPLSRWPFLSINASASWRNTWYSQSLTEEGERVAEWLLRQYFDLRATVTGPTFNRIWDTPRNGYAEKFKHVIEPGFSIQRVTLIDNVDRIVKLDSNDYTLGGTTRINYGLTNRFLAKRRGGGPRSAAREFLTIGIEQTYYTDARASLFDPSFGTSFGLRAPSNFSPVLLTVQAAPSERIDGGLRIEYDHENGEFLSITTGGRVAAGEGVLASAGWSRRRITPARTDNYLNVGTTVRALRGRVGGFFGFDYDFFRDQMLQRRIQAFYNAQCCGIAFEYQTYNFPVFNPRFLVPRDRRFNVSFTLAGIGSFSNIFGAFGNPDPARSR